MEINQVFGKSLLRIMFPGNVKKYYVEKNKKREESTLQNASI